jgi:ribonuclease PH
MVDAGIPLSTSFGSITAIIDKDGDLKLDPTLMEESDASSIHTIVYEHPTLKILTVESKGIFNKVEFEKVDEICRAGSLKISDYFISVIEHKVKQVFGDQVAKQ